VVVAVVVAVVKVPEVVAVVVLDMVQVQTMVLHQLVGPAQAMLVLVVVQEVQVLLAQDLLQQVVVSQDTLSKVHHIFFQNQILEHFPVQ
jgi:hypothetical protein